MLLLLDKKKASFFSRAWINLKIFVKEGLIHQDWKAVFKNRTVGGSITIPSELVQELRTLGIPFLHNDFSMKTKVTTVVVLKDPECVKWALTQKRKGHVQRVLAGPLVANLPTEANGILTDPNLDGLLFFSPWHRDVFLKFWQGPHPRTALWAAGVNENFWINTPTKRDHILIYNKNPDPGLLAHVQKTLTRHRLAFRLLTYGSYDLQTYQQELKRSRFVIFLSRTETQGVAMLEAWSSGVPSLHWNPGVWHYLGQKVQGASSCPYLTPDVGLTFQGQQDFESQLQQMIQCLEQFEPRPFVLKTFTRKQSAIKFLEIANDNKLNSAECY